MSSLEASHAVTQSNVGRGTTHLAAHCECKYAQYLMPRHLLQPNSAVLW